MKLLEEMLAKGARREHMRAKLVGGAQMFPNLNIKVADIGKQNIDEAKRTLKGLGIYIAAEDTLGQPWQVGDFRPRRQAGSR